MIEPENHNEETDLEVIAPGALESLERASIDMQIATAKKYPRDLAKVKREILSFATLDEETAAACFYSLPRGGKSILGPSVRLAEIVVYCYQNLRVASRVVDNDGTFITAQGICQDLERNNIISTNVSRRITDKQGKTYNEDMQNTTGNAGSSIAFRNAVFKTVPMALVKPAFEAARAVAVGNATTLVEKRTKMFGRLALMQATEPRVLARLGKSSIENVDIADLETLIGLGTAIKEGEISVDEAFPPVEGTSADQQAAAQATLATLATKKRGAKSEGAAKTSAGSTTPVATAVDNSGSVATEDTRAQATSVTSSDAPQPSGGSSEVAQHILDLGAMRAKLGPDKWADTILKNGFVVPVITHEGAIVTDITASDWGKMLPDFDLALRAKEATQPRLKLV